MYFVCEDNLWALTISPDGRIYIVDRDILIVREIDGSPSELSLRSESNEDEDFDFNSSDRINFARVCSDDGIVVSYKFDEITKYSKDGEFMWRIESNTTSYSNRFCLDSSDLLYCVTSDNQVKVYLPSGAFSHVLVSGLKDPMGIAIDGDNNIHVGVSSSILQVFSTKGKLIREYGHDGLRGVESIAISRDNPQLVVTAEYNSSRLFVFTSTGSFLYTVTVTTLPQKVACVLDVTFGPDDSLWIGEGIAAICGRSGPSGRVVRVPNLFHELPPPLSYLCELSILPHLNELQVSQLPPGLAGLFEKWTRLAKVQVNCRSFTDYPSKCKLISETIELKVEPDAVLDTVKWLVQKKMNLTPSAVTIRPGGFRDEGVDFVVYDR